MTRCLRLAEWAFILAGCAYAVGRGIADGLHYRARHWSG